MGIPRTRKKLPQFWPVTVIALLVMLSPATSSTSRADDKAAAASSSQPPFHSLAPIRLVAELDLLFRAVNSRQTTEILFHNGRRIYGDDFGFPAAVSGDLGFMLLLSHRTGLGVSGFASAEEFRHRAGVRLRYRFWDIDGSSIELSLGPAFDLTNTEFIKSLDRRQWLVGDISFSTTRFLHLVFRVESLLQDYPPKRRVSAAYAGLKIAY